MQNLSYTLLLIVLPHISTLPDTIMDRNILKENSCKMPGFAQKIYFTSRSQIVKRIILNKCGVRSVF